MDDTKTRVTGELSSTFSPDHFMKIAPQVFLSPAQPVRTALFCGAAGRVGCTSVCLKTAEALSPPHHRIHLPGRHQFPRPIPAYGL